MRDTAFSLSPSRLACLVLVLVATEVATVAAAEASLAARPGAVVRWQGPGTVACGAGGESWPPVGESCFYPFDLLAPAGEVEVWRQVGDERRRGRVRVDDYPYAVQRITLPDDRHVELAPADLARAEREAARVAELWQLRTPRRFSLPLAPPLARLPSGGRFGARRIINGEPRNPHTGADYAAAAGTPVLAVAAGTVVLAEEHFFAGKSVFVDPGDGLVSMVFHLSGIAVAPGDEVAAGEILGLVGATGRATGPHLHFGLRWRGARVDPALLLADPADLPALAP
ncbi:MAG TPA: M23 family metallopeptidase [Thermoanaerobaculia bacterium]|nr:M23 family metallopeptidase [Thermoanaerobaculia bacterium]